MQVARAHDMDSLCTWPIVRHFPPRAFRFPVSPPTPDALYTLSEEKNSSTDTIRTSAGGGAVLALPVSELFVHNTPGQ